MAAPAHALRMQTHTHTHTYMHTLHARTSSPSWARTHKLCRYLSCVHLPACLPASLPACLPACLPTYPPNYSSYTYSVFMTILCTCRRRDSPAERHAEIWPAASRTRAHARAAAAEKKRRCAKLPGGVHLLLGFSYWLKCR